MLGTTLGNVYGIILGIEVGTEMGSLDGLFDCPNDVNIEGLLTGDSLVYTEGKVIGSNKGIKLGLSGGKVIGTIL